MFKKTWEVFYWYYDTLGCEYEITSTLFKGYKTSKYIQGQGLSKQDLHKVNVLSQHYKVCYGFILVN